MTVTTLFKIGVDDKPYINPVFAHTLIHEPETINRYKIKAKVITEKGYETILVNSVEIWLEEEEE